MNTSRFSNPLTNRLQRIGKIISKEDFLQRVKDGTAEQTQEFTAFDNQLTYDPEQGGVFVWSSWMSRYWLVGKLNQHS